MDMEYGGVDSKPRLDPLAVATEDGVMYRFGWMHGEVIVKDKSWSSAEGKDLRPWYV